MPDQKGLCLQPGGWSHNTGQPLNLVTEATRCKAQWQRLLKAVEQEIKQVHLTSLVWENSDTQRTYRWVIFLKL